MRTIETVIQEVTNAFPKEELIYSDEHAFLGVDKRDQKIGYVPDDQVLVARQLLSGKPSGSKLHCYSYGTLIQYRLENIGYDNPAFTLTHTFTCIENYLYAISNIDSEIFLSKKIRFSNDPMNPYEIERRAISKDEWNRVSMLFELYEGDKIILAGNKLRHRQKHYRIFEIANDDEEGCSSRRIVKMTHTFYHINNKLYALAGNGHHISGAFGKVKIARQYPMQPDVSHNPEAELVVLKIPKKNHTLSKETCADIRTEYALYQTAGLCSATAVKQKTVAANGLQEICVMRFFHSDLFDNVLEGHLRKLVSHIESADSLPSREKLLINLIRGITDIFLKLLNQLDININQHQFLHRDIKLENIVLTTNALINELGQVVSIECVEALFIDFGAAKKIQKPGEWRVDEEYLVGTIGYRAPEVNRENNAMRYSLCYTDKTEIYALGKTLKVTLQRLFSSVSNYLNNAVHAQSRDLYQQLIHISNMMCFESPANRIDLDYARILLLNALWQSSCVDAEMKEVKKRELFSAFVRSVKSPFQHIETLTCLMTITCLTGVMIMHRTSTESSVELNVDLSKNLFLLFCRLDTLITYPRYREIIFQLLKNVNHILSGWDVAASPSPIALFEREIAKPDYEILRAQAHSSEASYIGGLLSGVGTLLTTMLSVGGLFFSSQSTSRRQRSENDGHDNDDDFYP